jgi:hypothetical protein
VVAFLGKFISILKIAKYKHGSGCAIYFGTIKGYIRRYIDEKEIY